MCPLRQVFLERCPQFALLHLHVGSFRAMAGMVSSSGIRRVHFSVGLFDGDFPQVQEISVSCAMESDVLNVIPAYRRFKQNNLHTLVVEETGSTDSLNEVVVFLRCRHSLQRLKLVQLRVYRRWTLVFNGMSKLRELTLYYDHSCNGCISSLDVVRILRLFPKLERIVALRGLI
jgi:hypothetical protein